MKSVFLLFAFTILSAATFGQEYRLSGGLHEVSNPGITVAGDFDKDGKPDKAVMVQDMSGGVFLAVFLSSYNGGSKPFLMPWEDGVGYGLSYNKDVLTLSSCFGNGRFCKTLKFKYYARLKNMRLIGYDEESFGNAAHEGAYVKTVNLLTNSYDIRQYRWSEKKQSDETYFTTTQHISCAVITLENISGKTMEMLENIGSKYIQ
ncbi:hypothetical protein ACTHGU_20915 [Chitinophagaceae bacterium MMS25-I14]